jgi:hypothetical protein
MVFSKTKEEFQLFIQDNWNSFSPQVIQEVSLILVMAKQGIELSPASSLGQTRGWMRVEAPKVGKNAISKNKTAEELHERECFTLHQCMVAVVCMLADELNDPIGAVFHVVNGHKQKQKVLVSRETISEKSRVTLRPLRGEEEILEHTPVFFLSLQD